MNTVVNYLKAVQAEFRNVTWPTQREAVRLTLIVIGASLLVGLFVGGADALLTKLLKFVVLK